MDNNTEKEKWPPISGDYTIGNPKASIAIATCGSYSLPQKLISNFSSEIAIAGFVEIENEGIAKIVQNIVSNPNIRSLVVCGEKVAGHEPGQTLVSLYNHGLDDENQIIGSQGTIPILLPKYFGNENPKKFVERFRKQIISLIDLREQTDLDIILSNIKKIKKEKPFEEEPLFPPKPKIELDWKKGLKKFEEKHQELFSKGFSFLNRLFFRNNELIVYDLSGVKIGGQRGEFPTVLAGTIFYKGDKVVDDHKEGRFNKKKVDDLILKQNNLSHIYNIPDMVHIVGECPQAMENYVSYVADLTDSPIIIDSPDLETRIKGIAFAKDIGISDRVIYNSIFQKSEKEFNELKNLGGVDYAILLPYDISLEGCAKKAEELWGYYKNWVGHPILDPGVPLLIEGGIGSLHTTWMLKNKFGFPAAIGIHNLCSLLPKSREFNVELIKTLDLSGIYILPTLYGIDINLYGPIKEAEKIFRQVAAIEFAISNEIINVLELAPKFSSPFILTDFK